MIQSSGRDGLLETLQLQKMLSARMLGSRNHGLPTFSECLERVRPISDVRRS